jgi:AcrR family transcriptional regulator
VTTLAAGTLPKMPVAKRLPYSVAARELLRDTLLDAACHELQSRRWADVTMADIARAAGVSRQTLYKEFGSRDEFAQTLLLRESTRFLASVEEAISANVHDPVVALGNAFTVFLTAAAENPLISAIVGGQGSEELLALFTTQGKPIVESVTDRLTAVMLAGWPMVDPAGAQLLAECLVRLAISYGALRKGPAEEIAASVTTLLSPYIESLFEHAHQ